MAQIHRLSIRKELQDCFDGFARLLQYLAMRSQRGEITPNFWRAPIDNGYWDPSARRAHKLGVKSRKLSDIMAASFSMPVNGSRPVYTQFRKLT